MQEQEHSASANSGFFSVRGQSHSDHVSQEPEDYQFVSSKNVSSVRRRWDKVTPLAETLCELQCESSPITDMCSICAAKGIGKIASHICRDCSQYGRYYCQSCWDYHTKFLPNHDTLSLSVSSDRECGTDRRVKVVGRIQNSDIRSSISRRRGTERNKTKAETTLEPSSVKDGNDECRIEIEKLNEKLELACINNAIREYTYATSTYMRTKKRRSPIKQQFDRVNEQADRIIEHLKMTRGMSYVKGKAQIKLVKNVTENVEREVKTRMGKINTCLQKLKEQIDANKFDALEFQEIGGNHEEKQIKASLEDICMKVKNISDTGKGLNDIQKILEPEISSLKNEISQFCDTDEPALENVQGNHPKLVKDILEAKQMLNQKKKEIAKAASKRKQVGRNAILQQHVDELWVVAFDSENNEKGSKCDEDNLLNMLEKIKPEIKKLKDLQMAMNIEIKALNDDIAKFDDPIEPCVAKVSSKHPGILNDILNARKQLNSKKKDVAKQIKDSKEERNKGISTLKQHVITLWQLTTDTKTDILSDTDDLDSVSSSEKLLTDIELHIKDEKNRQKEAWKEKQDHEQEIRNLWERIYQGRVISSEGLANPWVDIKTYVTDIQEKLEEFDRIEDLAFKVEERAHIMYFELTRSKHLYTDDPQTANGILKGSLEILKSCKNETNAFIEIVTMLEVDLNIDRKSDSVSNRCKAIKKTVETRKEILNEMRRVVDESTHSLALSYSELLNTPFLFLEPRQNVDSKRKKVPEWFQNHVALISRICACTKENKDSFQLRYVRREDYDNLQEKIRNLHVENGQLREDKDRAYNILSKVAGTRLTDNNPNIADFSDPNRPTKIAEQYLELYDDPWTDAYDILKDQDQENTDFLLKIIVNCYEICGNISKNHQRNLKNAVCFPADNIETGQASTQKKGKKETPVSFSVIQSKALSELRKQTADISVDDVISQIESAHKDWFGPKQLRSYTTRCIELCWLMHVQTTPIFIDTSAKPGSNFDTSRYNPYTKAGKKIDFIVWPVLLLEEGGAILCKGVAQGCKVSA